MANGDDTVVVEHLETLNNGLKTEVAELKTDIGRLRNDCLNVRNKLDRSNDTVKKVNNANKTLEAIVEVRVAMILGGRLDVFNF